MVTQLYKFLLFGFLGLLIWSCNEPPIVFTEPQPTALSPSPYISPIYRGTFLCESDSSIVHVQARTIFKEKNYAIATTKTELEKVDGVKLKDGFIEINGWQKVEIKEVRGDSIFSDFLLRDTLFDLSPNQIIKSFRGHHIISKKLRAKDWEVIILSLDYDLNLRLSKTILPEDLEQLESITPVENISTESKTQYRISPTVMEFDEILKQKLIFEECDYFNRIHELIQL